MELLWPVSNPHVTDAFGTRPGYWYQRNQFQGHMGLDMVSRDTVYATVRAAQSGVVSVYEGLDYGKRVDIRGSDGVLTRYAHLSAVSVRSGDVVVPGMAIGIMGDTGNAQGVHLHFEVIKGKNNEFFDRVNPRQFLPRLEGEVSKLGWHFQNWDGSFAGWTGTEAMLSMAPGAYQGTGISERVKYPVFRNWTDDIEPGYIEMGRAGGRQFVSYMCNSGRWPLNLGAVYYQCGNEHACTYQHEAEPLANFYYGALEEAQARGIRLAVCIFPEGNPHGGDPNDNELTKQALAWFKPVVEFAIQHGHIIGFHAYWKPGVSGPLDRWHGLGKRVFDVECWREMGVDIANLVCVMLETGVDGLINGGVSNPPIKKGWQHFIGEGKYTRQQYLDDILALDRAAQDLPWLKGFLLFDVGAAPDWKAAGYDHELADMCEVMAYLVVGDIPGEPEEPMGMMINSNFNGSFRRVPEKIEWEVADGWTPFGLDEPYYCVPTDREEHCGLLAEMKKAGAEIYGPKRSITGTSQQLFKLFGSYVGGAWQQISEVQTSNPQIFRMIQPGDTIRLAGRAMSWMSQGDNPWRSEILHENVWELHDESFFKTVGIDPTGGTNWQAPTVVWGRAEVANDIWTTPLVEVVAQSSVITVFFKSEPEWPFKHTDSYWDDMTVVYVDPPEETEMHLPSNDPVTQAALVNNDVVLVSEKARWWLEEEERQRKAGQAEYADAIRLEVIQLLYFIEFALKA